jgi:hypothetical protein
MHPTLAVPEPAATAAHRPARWADPARRLGAGLLAAVLLGTVAGLLAGALMRLVTLLAGDVAQLGAIGTVLVVVTFVVPMVPGAIAAAWRMRRTGVVLLVAGAAFLLGESVVILLQEDRAHVVQQGGATVALALVLVVAMWALVVVEAVAVGRASRAWGGRRAGSPS